MISLVCVGPAGHGKSTVLNEFAGKDLFSVVNRGHAFDLSLQLRASECEAMINGQHVKLVDTPGFVFDDPTAEVRYDCAIRECSATINGVLLVVLPERAIQRRPLLLRQLQNLRALDVPLLVLVNGRDVGQKRRETAADYEARRGREFAKFATFARRFMQEYGLLANEIYLSFCIDELEGIGRDVVRRLASERPRRSPKLLLYQDLDKRVATPSQAHRVSSSDALPLQPRGGVDGAAVAAQHGDMRRLRAELGLDDGAAVALDHCFVMAFENLFDVDLDETGGSDALRRKVDPSGTGFVDEPSWRSFLAAYAASGEPMARFVVTETARLDRASTIRAAFDALTPAERADCRRVFDAIDKDGSGRLDQAEFERALAALDMDDANSRALFAIADLDGDGSLCFDEFACLIVDAKMGLGRAAALKNLATLGDTALSRLEGRYGICISAEDALDASVADGHFDEARRALARSEVVDVAKLSIQDCNLCFNILVLDLDLLQAVSRLVCERLLEAFADRLRTDFGIANFADACNVDAITHDAVRTFITISLSYSKFNSWTPSTISQADVNHLHSLRKAIWFVACDASLQDVYEYARTLLRRSTPGNSPSTTGILKRAASGVVVEAVASELLPVAVAAISGTCSVM